MTRDRASEDNLSTVAPKPRSLECVEIYVPKKLEHLSELYNYLRSQLWTPHSPEKAIDGFSLYEVDGAFRGSKLYEERTLVVRIFFERDAGGGDAGVQRRIETLGRDLATAVALSEEELWICHYPQNVMVFRPATRSTGEEKRR